MHLTRVRIDTSNLSVGMYVGMLDRPWLETPFVFQGFVIRDKFEIEQLQSYCRKVYVEIERGKLTEKQIRAMAARGAVAPLVLGANEKGPDKPSWLNRFVIRMGLSGLMSSRNKKRTGPYEISSTVRREAPEAKKAYERCALAYQKIIERTRRRGIVDIESVILSVTPMLQSILRNPDAMAWTIFSGKRSGRSYSRAAATAVWAAMFGRHLGFDRKALQDLAVGGLLLDIGNVALPEDIVNAEGAITHEEYEQVPQHVQAGMDILKRSAGVEAPVFEMVAYHHERYDGSGYPHEMQGSDIPAYGRMAGIADCYDAMTTKTLYSPALAAYDAARELNDMRDTMFQTEVVAQFLHTIGMFPTGSVIEFSDGSAGLVLSQNRANSLRPKVMLIRDRDGEPFAKPRIVDMQKLPDDDKAGAEQIYIAKGHEHGAFGIDPLDYFN